MMFRLYIWDGKNVCPLLCELIEEREECLELAARLTRSFSVRSLSYAFQENSPARLSPFRARSFLVYWSYKRTALFCPAYPQTGRTDLQHALDLGTRGSGKNQLASAVQNPGGTDRFQGVLPDSLG